MSAGGYEEKVKALLSEAGDLPYGQTKYFLTEEAVGLADLHGDAVLGFRARKDLFHAAMFADNLDKLLVHYAWALGQCDRDPERFPIEDILWSYKWVVHHAPDFPRLSAIQIKELFMDLDRRLGRLQAGRRTIQYLRMRVAFRMGQLDEAQKQVRVWQALSRDKWSDCEACEADAVVELQAALGNDEDAFEAAAPLLSQRLSCIEVPHLTTGHLMYPLFRTGRLEDAMSLHRTWYPRLTGNRKFLTTIADHLEFLALTLNLPRALRLFERHLEWTLDSPNLLSKYNFYCASALLFCVVAEHGRTRLKLRLPSRCQEYQKGGEYVAAVLANALRGKAHAIAMAMDTRNGNSYYAAKLESTLALARRAIDFPFATKRKPPRNSRKQQKSRQ